MPQPIPPFLILDTPFYSQPEFRIGERIELKDPAAADESFIYFKKRIFGCCTDKDYRTVFHPREQRILLCAVPPVDFIHKEDGRLSVQLFMLFCCGNSGAYLLNSGKHRIQT